MALIYILRYFTEFVYNVVLKQLLGLPRLENLLLIVYDQYDLRNYSTIIWAKQTVITPFDGRRCIDD